MKKFLSLILALTMMISCAVMIFGGNMLISSAPDETASTYYDAVKMLVSYNIMHGKGDGKLGVYDNIKRYEMALFIGRILTGWTNDSAWEDGTYNSSEFNDLAGTAAQTFYGAISYVNQMGVIKGYGDGRFGPEDGIKYQDALTMAVRALGYNGLAYPWGFIEKAVNLGVTDGITGVAYSETLKREVVAQIIYNTLFAETVEGDTLGRRNFAIDGAWETVIITVTDYLNPKVPAGYVGFSKYNDDGTIGADTFYVPKSDFGFSGEHADEVAYAALYSVLYDGNRVQAYKALEMNPIVNEGRLNVTTKGYPIQSYLTDYKLVTKYSRVGANNEIIIANGTSEIDISQYPTYYAVDWNTGNILFVNEGVENIDNEGHVTYDTEIAVVWYYNELLNSYFQLVFDVEGEEVGVKWITDAERAALPKLVNGDIRFNNSKINYLETIEADSVKLNAYATLRVFDTDSDGFAEYGIYDEYRFGLFGTGTMVYTNNEGKEVTGPSYKFMDLSQAPLGTTSTALEVPQEYSWFTSGKAPATDSNGSYKENQYVIYGYKPYTGELTIVKNISSSSSNESYVGHGYVRGFNASSLQITVGDAKISYNYPQLKGSITEAMTLTHTAQTARIPSTDWYAVASRYLKELFNQYCEYVVVDERIAYITLSAANEDILIVEDYAGISQDGYIVVWGWLYDYDAASAKLTQLRVNSFNGWISGDWAYYSLKNAEAVEAAFKHGSVYQLLSYDEEKKAYNVKVIADASGIADYYKSNGVFTTLSYQDAVIGIMHINNPGKVQGASTTRDYSPSMRRMTDNDSYVFILGGEGETATIPIITYSGKVIDSDWYAQGYNVGSDGNWVMYIENPDNLIGFGSKADQGASLVLFIEYGSESAYGSLQGTDYLIGSVAYKAHVYDLITGEIKEVDTFTANLKPAQETNSSGTEIYTTYGYGSTYIGRPGPLQDGYYNYPFYHFYNIVGDVYRTVDDKIINDTPVNPADIPEIMNSMLDMDGSILRDGAFGETGIVTAKYNGTVADINKMWNNGWGGETYLQGFSPIHINLRMSYKALGESYNQYYRLDKYGLAAGDSGGVVGKSSVFVWAMKEVNGRVMIAHVACDDGGGKALKTDSQYQNAWNLVQPDQILSFYGDKGNNCQSYYYTLIYHENSTNTGKSANDRSYAVIYVYDFEDDQKLVSADFNPSAQPSCFGLEYNGKSLDSVWETIH